MQTRSRPAVTTSDMRFPGHDSPRPGIIRPSARLPSWPRLGLTNSILISWLSCPRHSEEKMVAVLSEHPRLHVGLDFA